MYIKCGVHKNSIKTIIGGMKGMRKTILSVLATSLVMGVGTIASAAEPASQSQYSADKVHKLQNVTALAHAQTINGPYEKFIATGAEPVRVIDKFKLESNKKVTIHGWQESTANGKAPAIEYQLVNTETNRVERTIKLDSEYKRKGTWFNKQFDMQGITVPKYYEIRAKNTSSYGVTLGFDLYIDFD